MDWDCEVEPANSHYTSATSLSMQMVSSFLQQNPHLLQHMILPEEGPQSMSLDFSDLKVPNGAPTADEVTNFHKAMKSGESCARMEYCKLHQGHKLVYI